MNFEDMGIAPRSRRIRDMDLTNEEWLLKEYPLVVKPGRRKKNPNRKVPKKHLTMLQRQRIILYRFGEIGGLQCTARSMKWIAAKMGVIYSTIVRIVNYYK